MLLCQAISQADLFTKIGEGQDTFSTKSLTCIERSENAGQGQTKSGWAGWLRINIGTVSFYSFPLVLKKLFDKSSL